MSIVIHTLKLGSIDNFQHIIADQSTGKAFVVDAGWDSAAIMQCLSDHQLTLSGILLTHSHWDHTSAVNELLSMCSVPVYISQEELQLGLFDVSQPQLIADGDGIVLGESVLKVIATPGHTKGSVCFYGDGVLVTGDTLFIDGCGRCNFPESDIDSMWDSLQKIKKLPDETVLYTGHDYGCKLLDTLGNQKFTNPYLLIENEDFFIEFRMNLQAQYRSIPFAPSSRQDIKIIAKNHGFTEC